MGEISAAVASGGQSTSSLRKTPNQRRSRERVETILKCAAALIAEAGSDALRMNELAKSAGISIGSLYQYFPDKGAVVQTLAERYNAEGRACIEAALAEVANPEAFLAAFGGLIDAYYEIFLAEPVMRDIWSGTQADKALIEIELGASRQNAALLVDALARLGAVDSKGEIAATAFMIMHMGEACMRLAISVDRDEGGKLVRAYKRMATAELRRMVESGCDAAGGEK